MGPAHEQQQRRQEDRAAGAGESRQRADRGARRQRRQPAHGPQHHVGVVVADPGGFR